MFYINNMTQMSCNFKEQSKIEEREEFIWGGKGGLEPSQAKNNTKMSWICNTGFTYIKIF
jgi:hypothetical protein